MTFQRAVLLECVAKEPKSMICTLSLPFNRATQGRRRQANYQSGTRADEYPETTLLSRCSNRTQQRTRNRLRGHLYVCSFHLNRALLEQECKLSQDRSDCVQTLQGKNLAVECRRCRALRPAKVSPFRSAPQARLSVTQGSHNPSRPRRVLLVRFPLDRDAPSPRFPSQKLQQRRSASLLEKHHLQACKHQ